MESTAAGALFAKYATVIGGFVGSVLSLSLLKDLTRRQAVIAVVFGFSCSQFTSGFVVAYFNLPGDADSQYGVAFLIGLLAMNIVPVIKTTLKRLADGMGA